MHISNFLFGMLFFLIGLIVWCSTCIPVIREIFTYTTKVKGVGVWCECVPVMRKTLFGEYESDYNGVGYEIEYNGQKIVSLPEVANGVLESHVGRETYVYIDKNNPEFCVKRKDFSMLIFITVWALGFGGAGLTVMLLSL